MQIGKCIITGEYLHETSGVNVKLQIAWKASLASFMLMHCLPSLAQISISKNRELYPFAYATVVCYVSKGKISSSRWQEAIEKISSQWDMPLSSITVTDIEMAEVFNTHIAPYFSQDCDPNKIPTQHVRSALVRSIDHGRQLLSATKRRNEAVEKENLCLQAQLDRDKSAAGKSYTERKIIEAGYSYIYEGQCIFTPIIPSF